MEQIKIALAGNPNCGKTTLFNILTGSNQYVGNWPGVTVEKKHEAFNTIDSDLFIEDITGGESEENGEYDSVLGSLDDSTGV